MRRNTTIATDHTAVTIVMAHRPSTREGVLEDTYAFDILTEISRCVVVGRVGTSRGGNELGWPTYVRSLVVHACVRVCLARPIGWARRVRRPARPAPPDRVSTTDGRRRDSDRSTKHIRPSVFMIDHDVTHVTHARTDRRHVTHGLSFSSVFFSSALTNEPMHMSPAVSSHSLILPTDPILIPLNVSLYIHVVCRARRGRRSARSVRSGHAHAQPSPPTERGCVAWGPRGRPGTTDGRRATRIGQQNTFGRRCP